MGSRGLHPRMSGFGTQWPGVLNMGLGQNDLKILRGSEIMIGVLHKTLIWCLRFPRTPSHQNMCMPQAKFNNVTMPSWMVLLNVVYIYIKLQIKFIGLFPRKFPMTLGCQGAKTQSYGAQDMILIGQATCYLGTPAQGIFVGFTTLGPSQNLNFQLSISQPFWNSIINGPKHALKVPSFFSFKLKGGGSFLHFPLFLMFSHYVPFKFPMSFHQVFNMLSKFPICSLTCSL